jgi:carbamoyltransferase
MIKKDVTILGINGWSERGHDASASIIRGNKILAMAEEERFIRKRYAFDSLPFNSIAFCLKEAELTIEEVDYLAFGWDLPLLYRLRGRTWKYSEEEFLNLILPPFFLKCKKKPKLVFIPHHIAHAAGAYYLSGFKEASILVLDGQGENASGLLAYGKDKKIKIIAAFPIVNSLGYFYEAVCEFLGFQTTDAGKIMGLAPYGRAAKYSFDCFKLTRDGYEIRGFPKEVCLRKDSLDEQEQVLNLWEKYIHDNYYREGVFPIYDFSYLRGKIVRKVPLTSFSKDLAASLQSKIEEIIFHLVKLLIKITKCEDLIIGGGVGLNCTVNGKLVDSGVVRRLFLQPATNDGGVSLGAALALAGDLGIDFSHTNFTPYLGPSYDDDELKILLESLKLKYQFSRDISKLVAKLLAKGKTVAWFQGRMEVGPRALGGRSLLANPALKRMHNVVNKIKSREEWRPLSPSILEEERERFFEKSVYSPFMLQSHYVKPGIEKIIPAVVHVDGTVRYQSVTKESNPKFYKLIQEFYRLTGIPLILNTSFNIEGEPIVCSPYDAIKTFFSSSIDYLAIGNFLVRK